MSQNPPTANPLPSLHELIEALSKRVAELESSSKDVDRDIASADRLFGHFEARVGELERIVEQLRPTLVQCSNCRRILRTKDRRCEFCNTQNS